MGDRIVTVATGDTLWGIAKKTLGAGHRWPEIYVANRHTIKDPNRINVGQALRIAASERFGVSDPHPLQRTRPSIAQLNGAATASPTAMPPFSTSADKTNPVARTTVNNTTVRFDLSLVPPVIHPIPGGIVKISWTGQVFIWKDGQRPLSAVGNKGLEISEKRQSGSVLAELLESRKLTVSPNKTVTYEDLMGVSTYGSPGTVVSSGFTMSTSNPIPTYRTQVKIKLRQGRLRDWLFAATDMTINFDIELSAQPPAGTAPQRVPVAQPIPQVYSGRIASDPVPGPTAMQKIGAWSSDHKEAIAVAVIGASVVIAFLTLGGSAAVEASVGLIATRVATSLAR